MSWDYMGAGSNPPRAVWLGDREYLLVPLKEHGAQSDVARARRAELQRIDSPDLKDVKMFEYDKLPPAKKRIRLLSLRSGTTGPDLICDLVEADYDNTFHIPTRVTDNDIEVAASTETVDDDKKKTEEERKKELEDEWDTVQDTKIDYESLSWCWGTDVPQFAVQIIKGDETFKKPIKKGLALALKHLRLPNRSRMLWIDAICINQEDAEERNHQVQMMSRIYTRSTEVCIWLGPDSPDSRLAIEFIRNELVPLKDFDTICSDRAYAEKWRALMMLMQREWFSRRWVVQEIALASKATVYCGPDKISWKDFAVAVELFVQVETETHQLSNIMQKDEKFEHIPGWFEYVSQLAASLLVQATGRVFRAQGSPMQEESATEDDKKKKMVEIMKKDFTIDPLERRSLLSLEYLVTTLFIFKATEPRDVVYSLLGIARDAAPFANFTFGDGNQSNLIMSLFDALLEEKPFVVDYGQPYSEVCRSFVQFAIERKNRFDPVQALDILCRPWALKPEKGRSIRLKPKSKSSKNKRLMPKHDGNWEIRKCQVESYTGPDGKKKLRYIKKDSDKRESDKSRTTVEYRKQIDKEWRESDKFHDWESQYGQYFKPRHKKKEAGEDGASKEDPKASNNNNNNHKQHRRNNSSGSDRKSKEKTKAKKDTDDDDEEDKDIKLPSWVARAKQAPFDLYHHPGMQIRKTGRANADPLVGQPQDGHRNYSAAQTMPVNLAAIKFRRRPVLGHYSLYVEGFKLDEVTAVRDASQGGNIPKSWLDLGGWAEPYENDPPDEFWRTMVADRGRDNRNPPYYYARACREAALKGGISSGRINTEALINNERNSIVAEFCRRVHAVIWNRSLFKTKAGRLGLANGVKVGDKVFILYGCTVPVILRSFEKKDGDPQRELVEDRVEALKSVVRKWEKNCERRAKYGLRKKDIHLMNVMSKVNSDLARDAYLRELAKSRTAAKSAADKEKAATEALASKQKAYDELAKKTKTSVDADDELRRAMKEAQDADKAVRNAEDEKDKVDITVAAEKAAARNIEEEMLAAEKQLDTEKAALELAKDEHAKSTAEHRISQAESVFNAKTEELKIARERIDAMKETASAKAGAVRSARKKRNDANKHTAKAAADTEKGSAEKARFEAAAAQATAAYEVAEAEKDAAVLKAAELKERLSEKAQAVEEALTTELTTSAKKAEVDKVEAEKAIAEAQQLVTQAKEEADKLTQEKDMAEKTLMEKTDAEKAAATKGTGIEKATAERAKAEALVVERTEALEKALAYKIAAEEDLTAKKAAQNTAPDTAPDSNTGNQAAPPHDNDDDASDTDTGAPHRRNFERAREVDTKVYYEFKGECYLHGMMDGEAMRRKFYDGIPLEMLELR
jgi:hypothetical protein